MQALWIIYDIVLDTEILALLKTHNVAAYTRWPRLTGTGPQSGPRLDDHVWPGANAAILTLQPPEVLAPILAALQTLRDEVGTQTGLYAFTTPVLSALR
ncbi:MAG: hypothetical protein J6Y19_00295 [Kiritimatiellae bacterium]|nr:hypothetical protein [Kiritimatiellia bacterium]